MWCCTLEYGEVNIEGFAVGSIMNQGFRNYSINGIDGYGDLTNPNGLENTITIGIDAIYDQTKLKLKWFVDGVEQSEYENMLSVTFDRPASNNSVTYSYQIEDLTGNLVAPNDPLNATDFYEGNFERSYYYEPNPDLTPIASLMPYIGSFEWFNPEAGDCIIYNSDGSIYSNSAFCNDDNINSSNVDDQLFGASCCSMGATFTINWFNYQQTSGQMSLSNNSKKLFFERPSSNINQKILSLNVSNDSLDINSISISKPDLNIIRDPILRKKDVYALEFFDENDGLIYKLGIGDPFFTRLQHVDMEDKEHFSFEAPISNLNVVIPLDINPSYITLIKRDNQNIYSEVSRYILN